MHQPCRNQRALLARINAYRLPVFEKEKRWKRAARFHSARRDQLRSFENMDGRKIAVFRFALVDVGESGIGGAEIDPDFQATRSRTLNSSFQRRPSRATHHNCSTPVSVTTVSNETGTTSDDVSPVWKLTSMGESSSSSSPMSSISSPG